VKRNGFLEDLFKGDKIDGQNKGAMLLRHHLVVDMRITIISQFRLSSTGGGDRSVDVTGKHKNSKNDTIQIEQKSKAKSFTILLCDRIEVLVD
jgi:hypothetical protein